MMELTFTRNAGVVTLSDKYGDEVAHITGGKVILVHPSPLLDAAAEWEEEQDAWEAEQAADYADRVAHENQMREAGCWL